MSDNQSDDLRKSVGLPPRPFLYTLDQIAGILSMDLVKMKKNVIYFEGKDDGKQPTDRMLATNLGSDGFPDWRISEKEFVRWCRKKRIHIYERTWA